MCLMQNEGIVIYMFSSKYIKKKEKNLMAIYLTHPPDCQFQSHNTTLK